MGDFTLPLGCARERILVRGYYRQLGIVRSIVLVSMTQIRYVLPVVWSISELMVPIIA
jgi:hypothetical protein